MIRVVCRILLVFIAGFIFSSCSEEIDLAYPSWYLENEEDSSYLYGVGNGESLEQAKSMALSDLSSQISLKVESAVSIEQTQKMIDDEAKFSSSADAKVDVSVLGIQLDSVEYVRQEEIDSVFYVKVRISKAKIIKQINAEIEHINIDVNSILGDVKATQCATISPQHKKSLTKLYNSIAKKANQIYALDGNISTQKAIDDLQSLVSSNSRAYYVAFASGSKTKGDYSRIDSGLNAEYKKFFTLEKKGDDKFLIENEYAIVIGSDGMTKIVLDVSIRDCVGNAIFSDSLVGKSSTYAGAINRLKVQLYKKLKAWQDSM